MNPFLRLFCANAVVATTARINVLVTKKRNERLMKLRSVGVWTSIGILGIHRAGGPPEHMVVHPRSNHRIIMSGKRTARCNASFESRNYSSDLGRMPSSGNFSPVS